MSVAKHKVTVFFDVVSPYAWLGFETILRYEKLWKLDLHLQGVFVGAIMKATGNAEPAMVPAKAKNLLIDVERAAKMYRLPIRPSAQTMQLVFAEGSLLPMRFVTALQMESNALGLTRQSLESLCRAFWTRLWSETQHIAQPEHVLEVARKSGLSEAISKQLLEAAGSGRVKDRLREATEEAIESGAFGVPWFVVRRAGDNSESAFFGSDRFEAMAHFLGEPYFGVNAEQRSVPVQAKL